MTTCLQWRSQGWSCVSWNSTEVDMFSRVEIILLMRRIPTRPMSTKWQDVSAARAVGCQRNVWIPVVTGRKWYYASWSLVDFNVIKYQKENKACNIHKHRMTRTRTDHTISCMFASPYQNTAYMAPYMAPVVRMYRVYWCTGKSEHRYRSAQHEFNDCVNPHWNTTINYVDRLLIDVETIP